MLEHFHETTASLYGTIVTYGSKMMREKALTESPGSADQRPTPKQHRNHVSLHAAHPTEPDRRRTMSSIWQEPTHSIRRTQYHGNKVTHVDAQVPKVDQWIGYQHQNALHHTTPLDPILTIYPTNGSVDTSQTNNNLQPFHPTSIRQHTIQAAATMTHKLITQ